MTRAESYTKKVELWLEPQLVPLQFELVDTEYVKEAGTWYLRVYIDKEGGIGVDDCETVSHLLDKWLDEEDFIPDSYILEVSSPGLGRPLKKEKDFARSLGKPVELHFYQAVDGARELEGVLTAWDADSVTVCFGEEEKTWNRKDIALIRQAIEF